jgi:hypothetical protein
VLSCFFIHDGPTQSFIVASGRPLPTMGLPAHATTFDKLLPSIFPDLFGKDITHNCVYRQLLFDYKKIDLHDKTTDDLKSLLFIYFLISNLNSYDCSPSI